MRKLQLIMILAIIILSGCAKDNFFDKYPPEILYYQNADVENANFNDFTLAQGVTQFTVKARVSAPYKLQEIKVYKGTAAQTEQELLATYSDFIQTPNVFRVISPITGISGETLVKIVATDRNNHVTTKIFTIKVTP